MNSQEFVTRLKELLVTEKKTEGRLALIDPDGDTCYCIEGLFGLALGGEVTFLSTSTVPESKRGAFSFPFPLYLNTYSTHIPEDMYAEFIPVDIPAKLILDYKEELNLTEFQKGFIEEQDDNYMWIFLNDSVHFSFEQFYKLLEILDNTGDTNETGV